MTKLQQHQQAMASNGFSPYFGWIWNGQQVSQADYQALDAKQARAEGWN